MSDQEKIISYYSQFDEWGRLDSYPGQLELSIMLELIQEQIPVGATIFDLGGGAGRYTYELAKLGYSMHLADLSPDLIRIAAEKLSEPVVAGNVNSITVANALDLSHIPDDSFEYVLLFGPLYHLTSNQEISQCLDEVNRILLPGGKLMAAYIPFHGGLMSIMQRAFRAPDQVDAKSFRLIREKGVFQNKAPHGFQEGRYLRNNELLAFMRQAGFTQLMHRSIRGVGYGQEKELLELENKNPALFKEIMQAITDTCADSPVINTCGHAIFVGLKQ